MVVFELPVGPASEVQLHQIGQGCDFLCAFGAVGKGSEFGHEPSRFHAVYVALLGGHRKGIERFTKFGLHRLSFLHFSNEGVNKLLILPAVLVAVVPAIEISDSKLRF